MSKKDIHDKKKTSPLAQFGLFYIIIIALFSVPLIATFVVVGIKGVLDLKYAIIYGGGALFLIVAILLIRFLVKFSRKVKQDGLDSQSEFKKGMARGEPVQVAIFNGLLTLTYGGHKYRDTKALPYEPEHQKIIPLIPETSGAASESHGMINQLKTLSDLRDQKVINDKEFQVLKEKLMKDSDLRKV